ncbi:MAG: leucine-rich repeat domain-containing protein [Bacteroidaceae bacterium]|nr:leucine-rich repeat domain-containing protein [Bacteroidaceae bacterium]
MLAIEVEIEGINYELVSKAKQAIVKAKSSGMYSGEVVIPESVVYEGATYSVTSIGYEAFSLCRGMTSVTIGNSVESIGDRAFYNCSGLTSVTIPNSVTSIGGDAFVGCTGLTSVHISDIAAWCNIDFGYSFFHPLYYAQHLYLNGEEVKDLVIPNSVTSIGDWAFYSCFGLTSVTIPNSVTSIGDYAFQDCSGLTSVTIGNSVESIGNYAFSSCSGLTSVTIPNSVMRIGNRAFSSCSGLTSVTIGNSVKSIWAGAFGDCPELLDVYCYAEKVPSTESNAFDGSYPEYATLHVPDASINSYRTTEPWSAFGTITSISGAVTPLPNITLTDGEEYENNIEQEVGTLTYTRTLPNMLWNPLYVPFKIPYEDLQENYEVAYINAMHSYDNDDNGEIDDMVMEIVKIKAGTLKPNHPYLIKAKTTEAMEMSIVQENTTLYPAEITTLDCSSVYTKFEITGTYQEMTSEDLNGSLVISTDGAWKKLSSTSTLKPFRFYLTISSREGSPVEIADEAMSRVRIRVMGEDDNATGIDEVKTANDELKSEIYDLSGRRVSAPAKGGVYIINGKKVIY